MDLAFKQGLPTWEQVQEVMDNASANDENAKAKALKMAEAIRNFIRYHFQDFALYADNTIDYGDAQEVENGNRSYMTSCTIGSAYKRLKVKGGSGRLDVTDEGKNTVFIMQMATSWSTSWLVTTSSRVVLLKHPHSQPSMRFQSLSASIAATVMTMVSPATHLKPIRHA